MFLNCTNNSFVNSELLKLSNSNADVMKKLRELNLVAVSSACNLNSETFNSELQWLMANFESTFDSESEQSKQSDLGASCTSVNSLPTTQSPLLVEQNCETPSVSLSPFSTSSTGVKSLTLGIKKHQCDNRRRSRSSPVWQFFKMEDSFTKCLHCSYSTKSGYNTNLKSHMKSHHPVLFDKVLEMETFYSFQDVAVKRSDPMVGGLTAYPKTTEKRAESIIPNVSALSSNFNLLAETHPYLANSLFALKTTSVYTDSETALQKLVKRRRCLRRHPVWAYFHDIDEKHIQCNKCNFVTLSSYTTNLKMHLKSHHHTEYVDIVTQELQSRKDEDLGNRSCLRKRKRKSIEEVETILENYKNKFNITNTSSSLLQISNTVNFNSQRSENNLNSSSNSSHKTVPVVTITPPNNTQCLSSLHQSSVSPMTAVTSGSPVSSFNRLFPNRNSSEELESLKNLFRTIQDMCKTNSFYNIVMQQSRELMVDKFINHIGSDQVGQLVTPVFQQLVACFDPNYVFPKDVNTLT